MIEKILLVNFQRHERLKIDFDEKVTVIVGPSDAGKSAIIRALRWVLTNKPLGDAYVRYGATEAEVRLAVDGHTISRKRGTRENIYVLDGQELKAFSTAPPDVVSSLLAVTDVNFQQQHDAPYWFSLTAGEVAKEINAVVDLSIIDDVLAKLASGLRSAKSDFEAVDRLHLIAQRETDELRDVPVMVGEFEGVADRQQKANTAALRVATLSRLVTAYSELRSTARNARAAANSGRVALEKCVVAGKAGKRAVALAALVAMGRELGAAVHRRPPNFEDVAARYSSFERAEHRHLSLRDYLFVVKRADIVAKKSPPPIRGLQTQFEELQGIKIKVKELAAATAEAARLRAAAKLADSSVVAKRVLFETVSGGACPVCGK